MLVSVFIKHYEGVMIRYKRPLVNHRECSLHKNMNSKSFIHHDLVVALSSQALFDISGVLVLIRWHIQYLPSFFLFFIFIFWKQAPEFNFLFFFLLFLFLQVAYRVLRFTQILQWRGLVSILPLVFPFHWFVCCERRHNCISSTIY